MRNLKKVLALVLSLVMALSLVTVVGAASVEDFADADSIGEDYKEAATVLTAIGMFKGNDNGFDPDKTFTRAELAGLMYKAHSKDVNDKRTSQYAGFASFTDVGASHWAAGYIGYCIKAGLVAGIGDNKFAPDREVTNQEVIVAMMQVAGYKSVGYTDWNGAVFTAVTLGVVDDMADSDKIYNTDATTRQSVCDIAFQILTGVPQVTWSTDKKEFVVNSETTGGNVGTLAETNLGLEKSTTANADEWGAPLTAWTVDGETVATVGTSATKTYAGGVKTGKVYSDLGLSGTTSFDKYTNGGTATAVDVAKSGTTPLGGNGDTVTVYYEKDAIEEEDGTKSDRAVIVVQSEFLAKVGKVDDKAMPLTIYGSSTINETVYSTEAFAYEEGDYLLVKTNATSGLLYTASDKKGTALTSSQTQNLWIVGEAEVITCKQTSPVLNSSSEVTKRTLNGTVYENQSTMSMGSPKGNANQVDEYNWYIGSAGYLIGAVKADTETAASDSFYGVITSVSATLTADKDGADVTVETVEGTLSVKMLKYTQANKTELTPLYTADNTAALTRNNTYLSISPVASVNAAVTEDPTGKEPLVYAGLFKFTAIPKKDGYNVQAATASEVIATIGTETGDVASGKLYKDYNRLVLASKDPITLPSNAQILVITDNNGSYSAKAYANVSALPGNMILSEGDVICALDSEGDITAVCFCGAKEQLEADTEYDFGLFYVNDATATLSLADDGETPLAAVKGYLNGVSKSLTFVQDDGEVPGKGIWAVKTDEDGLSKLMSSGINSSTGKVEGGFGFGSKYNNSYEAEKTFVAKFPAHATWYRSDAKTINDGDETEYLLDSAVNPDGNLSKLKGNTYGNVIVVYTKIDNSLNVVKEIYVVMSSDVYVAQVITDGPTVLSLLMGAGHPWDQVTSDEWTAYEATIDDLKVAYTYTKNTARITLTGSVDALADPLPTYGMDDDSATLPLFFQAPEGATKFEWTVKASTDGNNYNEASKYNQDEKDLAGSAVLHLQGVMPSHETKCVEYTITWTIGEGNTASQATTKVILDISGLTVTAPVATTTTPST